MFDRLKCWLGFHQWKHQESVTLGSGGQTVTPSGRVILYGIRTIHFRECERCGKEQQYYPD